MKIIKIRIYEILKITKEKNKRGLGKTIHFHNHQVVEETNEYKIEAAPFSSLIQ